jgi:hypothetical protein
MNERIREITGQVLDELVPETWVALGYDKIKEIQYRTAELIVSECISVMKSTVDESIDFDRKLDETSSWIESDIKKHFGVE